jgi:ABC-2 type transport system ATP-binding protein
MTVQPILSIKQLCFAFGSQKVLKNISLEIEPGHIFALIGPNGAGKSTLLRSIAGLLPVQKGSISIAGASIVDQTKQAKANQMLLTDNPDVYPFLTGNEFLTMHAALRNISQKNLEEKIKKWASVFPHKLPLDKPLGEQSRGTRQKIHIVSAMITQPSLLIFDEPIVGIDPTSITILGEQLQQFVQNENEAGVKPSVILALHTLDFAQSYATDVGILNEGSLVGVQKIGSTNLYTQYKKYTKE